MSSLLADMQKRFSPVKVGISEFSQSSDYCGKELFPLQEVLLKFIFLEEMTGQEEDLLTFMIQGGRNGEILMSPDLRKRRDWCRDQGYDHFGEVVMVGGRRSSKGHITGLAGAYKLFKTRDIPDPAAFFGGMDVDKQIELTCIAASFDQAKTRQFADLYSSINRCKALQPYISKSLEEIITVRADTDIELIREIERQKRKVNKDFAKFVVKPLAANADTLRGAASIFTVFDEMAFMLPGESRSSAQECYTAVEPSLAQFGHYALVFCNSSPYSKVGQFFEQHALAMIPEGSKEEWRPMRFAMQFPSWALYDKWWKTKVKSQPMMVSPDWPDQLEAGVEESKLDAKSIGMRNGEKLKEKANPDTYKVEYRALWAEVLDAYLNPDMVDLAYSGILPDGRECLPTQGSSYILAPYMAHCDPSSTTAGFGFALAHVESFEDKTGLWPDGMARHVVFDRVHRWNPDDFPGGTINYITVREELTHIVDMYRPTILTFDQYNSPGLIQELRLETQKRGIMETRFGKVDATANVNWNRWEAFKTALNLQLVHIPTACITGIGSPREFNHSEYSKQELKHLQLVATGQNFRVDKQELGPIQTKDIADCIAEVTLKFLGSYIGNMMSANLGTARIQPGAEGGYPIGGRHHGGPVGNPEIEGRQGAGRFGGFYTKNNYFGKGGFDATRGINPLRRRR